MRTLRAFTSSALVLMLGAATLAAHHNMTAVFDFNNRVTLTGTLTKVDWRNPHIEFSVDTKGADGTVEPWVFEGPSPSFFRTKDIGKADFEKIMGQMITVEASRARDGSRSGLLRVATLPDGKLVSACPQNC